MTTVTITEDIAGPAADVWAILGDFAGIQVGGPVTAVDVEGEGVGMVRTLSLGEGRIVERLDAHDAAAMRFAYSIINDDCALPVSDYSARVQITDLGSDGCRVEWSGTFEPKGAAEAEVIPVVEDIYRGGIARARRAVAG